MAETGQWKWINSGDGKITFLTYSSSIYTMIDELVNQLVLADSTHFTKVDTGVTTKACVKYTGDGVDRYIVFKPQRGPYSNNNYFWSSYSGFLYQYHIIVSIGGTWNSTTKDVETGIQNYYATLYMDSGNNTGLETTFFSTRTYSHKIWLDKNGFMWNCWNPYTDYQAYGFIMMLEFLPVSGKTYNDGASSIIYQCYEAGVNNANYYNMCNNTFFHYGQYGVFQIDGTGSTHSNNLGLIDFTNGGRAFKSIGDNKVYFDFARYHKNPGIWSNPFVTHNRVIICQKLGLAANDVLQWQDGTELRSYIVTEVGGSLNTMPHYFAIPYDNPPVYD